MTSRKRRDKRATAKSLNPDLVISAAAAAAAFATPPLPTEQSLWCLPTSAFLIGRRRRVDSRHRHMSSLALDEVKSQLDSGLNLTVPFRAAIHLAAASLSPPPILLYDFTRFLRRPSVPSPSERASESSSRPVRKWIPCQIPPSPNC